MSGMSRRDFLGQSVAAAGVLAASHTLVRAGTTRTIKSGADLVTLGRTGIKCSLLGMGTGSVGVRHSSNQIRLGHDRFVKLVHYAYEKGIT